MNCVWFSKDYPANTRLWSHISLTLGQRRIRLSNVELILCQRIVLAGIDLRLISEFPHNN